MWSQSERHFSSISNFLDKWLTTHSVFWIDFYSCFEISVSALQVEPQCLNEAPEKAWLCQNVTSALLDCSALFLSLDSPLSSCFRVVSILLSHTGIVVARQVQESGFSWPYQSVLVQDTKHPNCHWFVGCQLVSQALPLVYDCLCLCGTEWQAWVLKGIGYRKVI